MKTHIELMFLQFEPAIINELLLLLKHGLQDDDIFETK